MSWGVVTPHFHVWRTAAVRSTCYGAQVAKGLAVELVVSAGQAQGRHAQHPAQPTRGTPPGVLPLYFDCSERVGLTVSARGVHPGTLRVSPAGAAWHPSRQLALLAYRTAVARTHRTTPQSLSPSNAGSKHNLHHHGRPAAPTVLLRRLIERLLNRGAELPQTLHPIPPVPASTTRVRCGILQERLPT